MSMDKGGAIELGEQDPEVVVKFDSQWQKVTAVEDGKVYPDYQMQLSGLSHHWREAEKRVANQPVHTTYISSVDGNDGCSEKEFLCTVEPAAFISSDDDSDVGDYRRLIYRGKIGKEDPERSRDLRRVSTEQICDSLDQLDNELIELITGHINWEKKKEIHDYERMTTRVPFEQDDLSEQPTGKRPKAETKYYIFFLFLFLALWTAGSCFIVTIEDYDPHWLAYASLMYVLASLFVGLDLFDKLIPFISFWENCWNVDKLAMKFTVEWPTGDSSSDRQERRWRRHRILEWTKNFMGWNKCCSIRYHIRSKIEDKAVIVSACIRGEEDRKNAERLTREHKDKPEYVDRVAILQNVKFERRAPHLFMLLFFIFSLVEYILLKITDEEDGYDVPQVVSTLADIVFFYLAITLMIIALLSNWTWFSFACSEKAYIQGLLNISIVGFFVLVISRILRPPQGDPAMTWHKYHDWNKQVEGVVLTVIVLWVFLVLFFVISIAAFAEFANTAANHWGASAALSCFVGFAMIIMLAPPAPGNIIDVFGGFLIVMVLIKDNSEQWSFFSATAVALITVVALHYTGACFQWMIGKLPFAQQWMNRTFPIEMLATSDAVLGDANWFKVGLVGFVFLDTANGLNQGRIEMEFWTQLLSEWGAFPNGLCLVTFGATLAISGLSCVDVGETTGCLDGNFNWTAQALPLLFIMSGITQIVGTSFGAGALAGSMDTDKYIMSREKWYIVHRMMKVGYIPTKTGWKEDVYELASTNRKNEGPYFEKACKLQHDWLQERKEYQTPGEVTEALEKYRLTKWIPLRYKEHMKYLLRKVMEMEKNDHKKFNALFRKKEREDLIGPAGMWDDVQTNKKKKIVQCVLVVILTICFYFGIFGFYMSLDFKKAVNEGLDFLWKIAWYYWLSAGIFVLVSCIYYFNPIKRSLLGIFAGIFYFLKCCPTDSEIETGFLTPVWESPRQKRSRSKCL